MPDMIDAMPKHPALPLWAISFPVIAWLAFAGNFLGLGNGWDIALALGLLAAVLAAVHAEVAAHRVGEPYGTLVLAIAITVIEVGLIVTLMLAGGPSTMRWRATPCLRP